MLDRETLPKRMHSIVLKFPERPIQHVKDPQGIYQPTSFKNFWRGVEELGSGLAVLGVKRGSHVGIIADNRAEWLMADQAVLGLGGVNVPRGCDSTQDEIAYILSHGDCTATFVEDKNRMNIVLRGLTPDHKLGFLVVMDNSLQEDETLLENLKIINFKKVRELGAEKLALDPDFFSQTMEKGDSEDLATIIYTSGTTGQPKGVMLTHTTFLFQADRTDHMLIVDEKDILLSVLPIWHSFERAVEYIILGKGASIAYSKPIGKILMEDIAQIQPSFFPSVPRIWESVRAAVYRNIKAQSPLKQKLFEFFAWVGTLHANFLTAFQDRMVSYWPPNPILNKITMFLPLLLIWPLKLLGDLLVFQKIRAKLGGRFKAGISGGGALPAYVDEFFRAAGILVLEGYGLTETGPILSVRLQWSPMPGTVGPILPGIEYQVRAEDGTVVGPGHRGVLWVKSPQVMKGYYKRPDETAKVLVQEWLNTGDIVVPTVGREITIVGRSKDTIVLLGGENIEPEPIEMKILQSDFIDQVMVVGQDQKFLGALVVPNMEFLEKYAQEEKMDYLDKDELRELPEIQEMYHEIIQELVSASTGFKHYERIYKFTLLPKPFDLQTEVTQTLKLKRNVIAENYHRVIQQMFQ